MIHHPAASYSSSSALACATDEVIPVKNPAGSDAAMLSRKRFAALLWRAFPSPSEHDLSLKAARALDVSPRQVKNWLRCENDASLRYVFAVVALAGAEIVFKRIEGE